MKNIKLTLFAAIAIILTLIACKKIQPDFDIAATDPCDCASEVSADFDILELNDPINQTFTKTDTTFHDAQVQFRALEENASYTWYIGIDTFNTQAASRYFTDQWIGFDIPITLVVKKEPNKTCFPNDDGYDSITKTFYVSQYPIIPSGDDQDIQFGSIEGTYRVYSKELNDSIDISFDVDKIQWRESVSVYNVDGLGTDCEKSMARLIYARSYRYLEFISDGIIPSVGMCRNLNGYVWNRIDGVAEIHLISYKDENNIEEIEYVFDYFGRKLHN
jgi:hypothetical protein